MEDPNLDVDSVHNNIDSSLSPITIRVGPIIVGGRVYYPRINDILLGDKV